MYSSEVYASVFRNQNLSLTAQFDLGVRYIGKYTSWNPHKQKRKLTTIINIYILYKELDLHYIPELNTSTGGPYRICHASSQVYTYCDNVTGNSNKYILFIINTMIAKKIHYKDGRHVDSMEWWIMDQTLAALLTLLTFPPSFPKYLNGLSPSPFDFIFTLSFLLFSALFIILMLQVDKES